MRKYVFLLMLGVAAAIFVSCTPVTSDTASGAADSSAHTTATTTESIHTEPGEAGVEVGGAMMVPSKNIVENTAASLDHTTLVTAIRAAGLVESLRGAGPFTVFAPNNEAFNKLPAGTLEHLLEPQQKATLAHILTGHVVAGAYKSAALRNGMELTTIAGKPLKIRQKGDAWFVNGAKIVIADVVSSNGITYVIDSLLMPE